MRGRSRQEITLQQNRYGRGSSRGGQFARSERPQDPDLHDDLSVAPPPTAQGKAPGSKSVSKVLGVIDAPAIDNWKMKLITLYALEHQDEWRDLDHDDAYRLIRNAPNRVSQRAAQIGTQAHAVVEAVKGNTDLSGVPEDARPFAAAAADFLRDTWDDENVAIASYSPEIEIASLNDAYHGRADLLVETSGPNGSEYHIVDWKTTTKTDSDGPYPESALQVAAYAHAESYRTSSRGQWQQMPPIASAWVVQLRPDGTYVADETSDDRHWRAFQAARELTSWKDSNHSPQSHATVRVSGGGWETYPSQSNGAHPAVTP